MRVGRPDYRYYVVDGRAVGGHTITTTTTTTTRTTRTTTTRTTRVPVSFFLGPSEEESTQVCFTCTPYTYRYYCTYGTGTRDGHHLRSSNNNTRRLSFVVIVVIIVIYFRFSSSPLLQSLRLATARHVIILISSLLQYYVYT